MLTPKPTAKTIRVGSHRGKARIWIQGKWLKPYGFTPGGCWSVSMSPGLVVIEATESGRKISRKGTAPNDVPILDLNSPELAAVFPPGTELETITTKGRIEIRRKS